MALVSPGLQLTVTDESQYVSTAVGTVPLVFLATAQNKTINGSAATGTSKANANSLQIFGSQRELATALGYPVFNTSAAGTPLHGDEQNEYGLMTAYSALGLANQLYAVRADIDLDQLTATAVRPTGLVADGTYWLDLADTTWGIFEWSSDTQTFTNKVPLVITSTLNTTLVDHDLYTQEPTPLTSIGRVGSYAVVATTTNNRVFYKRSDNTWVLVASKGWQQAWPTVTGTIGNPTLTNGSKLKINGTEVTLTGTTISALATAINSASITGVTAGVVGTGAAAKLAIYSTYQSTFNSISGRVVLDADSDTLLAAVGLSVGSFNSPITQFSSFASVPSWTTADSTARSNGSVWFKTGATGNGANFVVKIYNAATNTWTTEAVNFYNSEALALNGLDPSGGGLNIGQGTVWVKAGPYSAGTGPSVSGYRPYFRHTTGITTATGNATNPTFTNGSSFTLEATQPGTSATTSATITLAGTTATAFVSAVLAAGIRNVNAQVESSGAITLQHLTGGYINLIPINGQPDVPSTAGFVVGETDVQAVSTGGVRITLNNTLVNPDGNSYTYSLTIPHADPANGTLWYYSDEAEVDVMINNGTAWKGYQNVTSDVRGYNLSSTDPMGVIVSASKPTAQSDNSPLVRGDLWLDSSEAALENYPMLSRYNGSAWIAIDNTDQISQNGIVFGDARWSTTGTSDPVIDDVPSTVSLLTSDYLDLDAPDARLYPRGTLLFNTRRSGFNVKSYVMDYFNADAFAVNTWSSATSYPKGSKVFYGADIYVSTASVNSGGNPPTSNASWSVLQAGSWVTASGLKDDGSPYSGHKAQRQMIVEALRSAIDTNTQIREDQFQFNLVVCPGYPEVIANMVALNNERANTAFIIGDTPMTLAPNAVAIANWSNNTNGDGLATSDPYLGIYYPSAITNDLGGNTIMVPPSHVALRTFMHNDNVSFPWFAPAGTRRGLVDNATDIGYLDATTGEFKRNAINQGLRDTLYTNRINPITILTGIGLVVWGQKTRNPTASAMDRVNVARLVNYIRTILASVGNGFLFEPNDKITRDGIKSVISSALGDLISKRGIYDYLVVCDTSNNTSDRIARNELYVDIAIEPTKSVEFIYIPIRLLNPGGIKTLGK